MTGAAKRLLLEILGWLLLLAGIAAMGAVGNGVKATFNDVSENLGQ